MNKPTLDQILKAMQRHNYEVFDGMDPTGARRDLDINLFGVRSAGTKPNAFDDWVGAYWFDLARNAWEFHAWSATTDPGLYYLKKPMSVAGTAILVEGQYRSSHQLGLHQGKYMALVQRGPLKVYRDRDHDDVIDMATDAVQSGIFGINIHRASALRRSTQVDRWSAGCQVLADPGEFDQLIDLCNEAAQIWGPMVSYTLLTEAQLRATMPRGVASSAIATRGITRGGAAPARHQSDDAVDALLGPVVKLRRIEPKTFGGFRAHTALVIAEALLGKITPARLEPAVPGAINDPVNSRVTADRLNREHGPGHAQQTGVMRWVDVSARQLEACDSVLSFLRVCFRQLEFVQPGGPGS